MIKLYVQGFLQPDKESNKQQNEFCYQESKGGGSCLILLRANEPDKSLVFGMRVTKSPLYHHPPTPTRDPRFLSASDAGATRPTQRPLNDNKSNHTPDTQRVFAEASRVARVRPRSLHPTIR